MDKKRILLVVVFIGSVVVFGTLLYYAFFRSFFSTPIENTNVQTGNLPSPVLGNISVIGNTNRQPVLPSQFRTIDLNAPSDVARGGLTTVVEHGSYKIDALAMGSQGPAFYNPDAAMFYRLEGGRAVPMSSQKFYNVDTITWAGSLQKAVLEYPDGSNVLYDFARDKQITLPKELQDFAFDKSESTIAAKWYGKKDDENWLMVGDANGAEFQLVEPLGDRGHNVQVGYSADNTVLALVGKASSADSLEITPIGAHGENYKSFNANGLNYESKWSPTGNNLLYSVANKDADYKPTLFIASGSGGDLGLKQTELRMNTWPSKCAFNSGGTSLYCAEPLELPRGAGLYPEIAQNTADAFYRIDLRTGQKIPLALPVGSRPTYSARSVTLSADESQLYFTDTQTNQLYSIRLK